MKNKYSIGIFCFTSWCGLGFLRGINSYAYNHNKYEKNEHYIYSYSILHGFGGIILYANPILLPIFIHKELYRLEINIRNLENEKNSKFYNDLV